MRYELALPEPGYSRKNFLADVFLQHPHRKMYDAYHYISRMLDGAEGDNLPEQDRLIEQMCLYAEVRARAMDRKDWDAMDELEHGGILWLQDIELQFCKAMLHQIWAFSKHNLGKTGIVSLRAMRSFAFIKLQSKDDRYLLKNAELIKQVITITITKIATITIIKSSGKLLSPKVQCGYESKDGQSPSL